MWQDHHLWACTCSVGDQHGHQLSWQGVFICVLTPHTPRTVTQNTAVPRRATPRVTAAAALGRYAHAHMAESWVPGRTRSRMDRSW
jgi:hypothetical protein